VWTGAVNLTKNRRAMKRAQRTALIITSTAYRTVSHAALCVLTGNVPIYIKVKMLKESYEKSRIYKRMGC
jgi:hypothetical protein